MWSYAALILAAMQPAERSVTFEGEVFGPRRVLTCTWFTNFENSRFEQCRERGRETFADDDGASVVCPRNVCRRLGAKARRVSAWRKPEPVWGHFTVRLVGRISLSPRRKRYLGDGTRSVLVERVSGVSVLRSS